MLKPRFSPEINFGHVMQAGVLVLTVSGAAVTSYVSLREDIEHLRADLTMQIAEHELRIAAVERELDQRRSDDRDFRTEMRAALTRIFDALGDLRTQVVQKQDKH
jgi:predicted component of type VI protein secretion system